MNDRHPRSRMRTTPSWLYTVRGRCQSKAADQQTLSVCDVGEEERLEENEFNRQDQRQCLGSQGFTLLELLVVIAILGLLIGLVAPAALRQLGNARTSVAKQSIERIASVLDMYKLDVGGYPTTDQGLRALVERPTDVSNWNGPYVKGAVPVDPWNHAYVYREPSGRPGHDFDLCSEGPSGTGGDQELCNQ